VMSTESALGRSAGLAPLALMGALVLLGGCSGPRVPTTPAQPAATPATTAAPAAAPAKSGQGGGAAAAAKQGLPPPQPVSSQAELRKQAALRLVAANPERTYMSEPPAVLLAIPVLEVELHRDGHIKRINILRRPGQAPDTVQLAIDALHRAAPFGNVSRMPEPWKFNETFLFNDDRRFKPRTLD